MEGRRPAASFSVATGLLPPRDQQPALAPDPGKRPLQLESLPEHPIGERLYRLFGVLIGPLLVWYMFFDKAGAYVHIPGTPLYLAECLLLVAILASALATGYLRITIRDDPLLTLLGFFILWGLARTIPELPKYGINSVRDAALWYYSLFAIFIVVVSRITPDIVTKMVNGFSRVVPWLLVWLPIALILPRVHNISIKVPLSPVNIFEHRATNVGVVALVALAFLWLVPNPRRSERHRIVLSVVALTDIALAGTQSRGGFGAACIAIIVALVFGFVPYPAKWVVKGLALIGVTAALVLLLSVSLSTGGGKGTPGQGRAVSLSQLVDNVISVSGNSPAGNQGNLQGALVFRNELWSRVLAQQIQQDKLPLGFGFGINLGTVAGFGKRADNPNLELQSPHNSHLDVFARMGIVGAFLWVLFWLSWFSRLVRARKRLRWQHADVERGVVELCIISVVAILIGCTFDPTLESAQMAALLWTLTGIGLLLSSPRRWVSVRAPERDDRNNWPARIAAKFVRPSRGSRNDRRGPALSSG